MLSDFEDEYSVIRSKDDSSHHEDTRAFRSRYQKHVQQMVNTFEETGNPFEGDTLVTVGSSKLIMSISAEKSVRDSHCIGLNQYNTYVNDRLLCGKQSVHDLIPRNNLQLYHQKSRVLSKDKVKIHELRSDSNLFCRMYVAAQHRTGNVDEFFAHENNKYPPSICQFGKMRKPTNKSAILNCLEQASNKEVKLVGNDQDITCMVLDGAAIVHMLNPGTSETFSDYCINVFEPYVDNLLRSVKRIDIVFDCYRANSLKADTRESRGSGQKIVVQMDTKFPRKFKEFLTVNENKEQLFHLLADRIVQRHRPEKVVICTFDDMVKSSCSEIDIRSISTCTIEEADGRLLLHAKHAVESGHVNISIRTVDSDVVVIAIYSFNQMGPLSGLWIEFGVEKYKRTIAIHDIVSGLPANVTMNLPFFHAFTGCDTVSTFSGIGKRTASNVWMKFREVDEVFNSLSAGFTEIDSELFRILQRYIVLLYDRSSDTDEVNICRRLLYTKKNRSIENIPPTSDTLLQHTKRATLQADIWKNSLHSQSINPPATECGWVKSASHDRFEPLWMSQSDVSQCSALISCTCKETGCKSKCKCVKMNLTCTQLCRCEGQCSRSNELIELEEELNQQTQNIFYEVEEDYEVDNVLDYFEDDSNYDDEVEIEELNEIQETVDCVTEESYALDNVLEFDDDDIMN